MFAAVPDLSDQWFGLADKGATTYVVEHPGADDVAFLDLSEAEAVADAVAGGEFWRWEGQIGWTEQTPARTESEPEAGQ